MKVVVISGAFPPMRAGEADHTLYLCRHLANRGLDIHLLTTKGSEPPGSIPFRIYPLMQSWSWSELPRFAGFIRRSAPEAILLIYSGWIFNSQFMITFAPIISKILAPRAVFVTQFEIEYLSLRVSLFTHAFRKMVNRYLRLKNFDFIPGSLAHTSDGIVVLSERHKRKILERFPRVSKKIAVIPPPPLIRVKPANNGASRQHTREALGVKPDEIIVAYFGYVYSGKGVDTLFRAFQILTNQRRNLRLLMIGAMQPSNNVPYLRELYKLAQQLGIDSKIIWTGEYAWDSDDGSGYLQAADACVLPFDKGVSLNRSSFAAAAAHGLPIVTTRGEFLAAPFVHGQNVFLCKPKDPDSVALAIDSVMSSSQLNRRLRIGVEALAREWFCWDKAVTRTINLLKPLP